MKRIDLLLAGLMLAAPVSLLAGMRAEDAVAAPAPAAAASAAREAQIHSANHGGIWDWDVVDSSTLLIQDRARRWYKAKLLVNCVDLPFEHKIGFESNADGSFDKFSAIQTRQQRCPLASLTRTDAPAKKLKNEGSAAAKTTAAPRATQPLN